MSSDFRIGLFLALVATASACRPTLVPGRAFTMETFSVPAPRERVVDAALSIAQRLNLQVAVIEKASGLIRFENAALIPLQLDQYCIYPYRSHDPRTNRPEGSFIRRNEEDPGSVRGAVTLNILIADQGASSQLSLRANWTAVIEEDLVVLDSRGTLEGDFRIAIFRALEAEGETRSIPLGKLCTSRSNAVREILIDA